MTGELHETLVAPHDPRAASPTGAAPERAAGEAAFARGVERGLGSGGFMHDIFGARTLVLAGELAPGDVAEWLSGLLIGREIRTARSWADRGGHDASRVLVVGGDALGRALPARASAPAASTRRAVPPTRPRAACYAIARAAGRIH